MMQKKQKMEVNCTNKRKKLDHFLSFTISPFFVACQFFCNHKPLPALSDTLRSYQFILQNTHDIQYGIEGCTT